MNAIITSLLVHLGLTEAIAKVIEKVMTCPMCLSFWAITFALIVQGNDIFITILIASIASSIAPWLAMLFHVLTLKYNKTWQKINQSHKTRLNPRK